MMDTTLELPPRQPIAEQDQDSVILCPQSYFDEEGQET